ncbi:cap-specific mRNA (nucleoside-2'-O-)-methyltransferase 2-like [Centruroides sculpturatus]|uniref:cap-specific mRNA (nucleoside-2'-O-)-methyltransferase 2-like n=1 Tax=Centruroides sculpturatus TaxID=218467 RepID=UPI000C6DD983|nr:cap-specific mRNA (nucleoside-2'-O-)-methyltransferase 2-like [Centruroides sculpturatus]
MENLSINEAQQLFEKKFEFKPINELILPDLEVFFTAEQWKVERFIQLKKELNETKNLLNDKEIKQWRRHTTYTNRAGFVLNTVRCEIGPELLTQAWLKFYEILSSYPLVPCGVRDFSSFHLCEAPGAFVTALNHYVSCLKWKVNWKWKANTLNPYYEGNCLGFAIMDDRFLIKTLKNWHFGNDNTGNILNPVYLYDLMAFLEIDLKKSENLLDLITADGSIDCQENPAEQENLIVALNFAEVVIALHLLKDGGNFVLKMFTIYECDAICIMYLLNCIFQKVNLFKPATSKSGNSEVYVVCLNYKGRNDILSILEVLRKKIGCNSFQKALFPLEIIPDDFLEQLYNCCSQFKDYQEMTIKENLRFYKGMSSKECLHLNSVKEICADMYVSKYKLKRIKKSEKIINTKEFKNHQHQISNTKLFPDDIIQQTQRSGSFNSRHNQQNEEQKCRLKRIKKQLSEWFSFSDNEFKTVKFEQYSIEPNAMWIKGGFPYKCITNSRFCYPNLLSLWMEFGASSQLQKWNFCRNSYNWHNVQNDVKWVNMLSKICVVFNICKIHTSLLEEFKNILPLSINVRNFNENVESIKDPKLIHFDPFCCIHSHIFRKEIDSKKHLIEYCIKIINVLNANDCFALYLQGCLTRFTVGVIYLLSHLFSEMFVLSPSIDADSSTSQLWLFSAHYMENKNQILKHFENINSLMESSSRNTVIEVIPIEYLCEDPFFTFVMRANQSFLTRQLHKILSEIEK